jgi:hypothetical protein
MSVLPTVLVALVAWDRTRAGAASAPRSRSPTTCQPQGTGAGDGAIAPSNPRRSASVADLAALDLLNQPPPRIARGALVRKAALGRRCAIAAAVHEPPADRCQPRGRSRRRHHFHGEWCRRGGRRGTLRRGPRQKLVLHPQSPTAEHDVSRRRSCIRGRSEPARPYRCPRKPALGAEVPRRTRQLLPAESGRTLRPGRQRSQCEPSRGRRITSSQSALVAETAAAPT